MVFYSTTAKYRMNTTLFNQKTADQILWLFRMLVWSKNREPIENRMHYWHWLWCSVCNAALLFSTLNGSGYPLQTKLLILRLCESGLIRCKDCSNIKDLWINLRNVLLWWSHTFIKVVLPLVSHRMMSDSNTCSTYCRL